MPTLAMEANRDVEKFMSLLDEKIFEAKKLVYKNSNLIIINEELLFDKLDIL